MKKKFNKNCDDCHNKESGNHSNEKITKLEKAGIVAEIVGATSSVVATTAEIIKFAYDVFSKAS